jgi:uncharacterized membrane protein
MTAQLTCVLLFIAAIGSALNAGIFYAFSSFVMGALGRIPAEQGINAMNSINVVVINPSFTIVFMGTTLLCVGLAIWSLFFLGDASAWLVLGASLIFVIGCFGVTMVFNVPLNNQLTTASPDEADSLWRAYLRTWTMWNHVRAISPVFSAALFILALLQA